MASELTVRAVEEIPGMFIVDLVLHGDERGWFKENYQQAKMEALGLPHFAAVQNNISFNAERGVTRGLHAEPWDKYVSMAYGKAFGVWVDLRAGDNFGQVFTHELSPEIAIFIPKGVANGYQTLQENSTYSYLVTDHWSADGQYVSIDLFDPDINIQWPVSKGQAIYSEKDTHNPAFKDLKPMEF